MEYQTAMGNSILVAQARKIYELTKLLQEEREKNKLNNLTSLPNKELQPTEYYAQLEKEFYKLLHICNAQEKQLAVSIEQSNTLEGLVQGSIQNTNKCILKIQALEKLLEVYRKRHYLGGDIACEQAEKEYEQTIRGLNNG